ncbi:unnamed protein product [Coffea canephora]|uniref:DH200=94 genomic scaffold, scaffold_2737 n=1 Tax=Coffea canephora TaxID=49390 RepID=A0A068VKU5_COFCA|nr:unnamed protein product [Coffea canephora]
MSKKIWHSSRQCIIPLHHLEKVLSCSLAAPSLSNKFQLCPQVHLLWILHLGLEDFQRLDILCVSYAAMPDVDFELLFQVH